jgi:sugar lactone lactonase YvrE
VKLTIRCVLEAQAALGEGPLWCAESGLLYWVDILAGQVRRFDPASKTDRFVQFDGTVGAVALEEHGGLLVALGRSLVRSDSEGQVLEVLASADEHLPTNRFNDGKCDRLGRFWVGSMDMQESSPTGSLYCLDLDRSLRSVLPEVTIGNGLGWSPSGDVMYFTDSPLRTIYSMDFDGVTGRVGPKRTFAMVDPDRGFPDGLTVDTEGFVWSAHWEGGCLSRYSPGGALVSVVELPVPRPTSVAFGGPGLQTLYVTSARVGLGPERLAEAPLSGGLFAIDGTGCAGSPEPKCRVQ